MDKDFLPYGTGIAILAYLGLDSRVQLVERDLQGSPENASFAVHPAIRTASNRPKLRIGKQFQQQLLLLRTPTSIASVVWLAFLGSHGNSFCARLSIRIKKFYTMV